MRWWLSTWMQPSRRKFGADHLRELGVGIRPERRIDAVKGIVTLGGVDDDAVVAIATAWAGPSTHSIPAAFSFSWSSALRLRALSGRNQGDVGGVAADEQSLGDAMTVAADHADALVGDLIAVADRAIADEPARQRVVVELLVHRRAAVGDSGRERTVRALRIPSPRSR